MLAEIREVRKMITDRNIRDMLQLNGVFTPSPTPVYCRRCGTRLKAYYAEESVYLIRCGYCEYTGIVRASNPTEASRYFGEYHPIEKGGEEDEQHPKVSEEAR